MSLRQRTILVIAVAVVILIAATYLAVRTPLVSAFDDVEKISTRKDAVRLSEALAAEVSHVEQVSASWGPHTEVYEFMQGRAPAVAAEFTPDLLANLGVDAVILLNTRGEVVLSRFADSPAGSAPGISSATVSAVTGSPRLQSPGDPRARVSGLMRIDGSVAMVSATSITTPDRSSAPDGTFVAVRYIDAAEAERLGRISNLPVSVFPVTDSKSPAESASQWRSLLASGISVAPASAEAMSVFALARDLDGEPALVLKATTPRLIHGIGRTAINSLGAAILILGLAAMVSVAAIVDRGLLERLHRLSAEVSEIGADPHLAARVTVQGTDEIGTLASTVNVMMNSIEMAKSSMAAARDELEKRVEQRTHELAVSEERFRLLVHRMTDAVITTDCDGRITFANERIGEFTTEVPSDLIGRNLASLLEGELPERLSELMSGESRPGTAWTFEARLARSDGFNLPVELRCVTFADPQGKPLGLQCIVRDITERQSYERQLVHMANHDFLTGLRNRRYLESALELELAESRRTGRGGVILWLDLDDFKHINDTYGHRTGDEALIGVADRLRSQAREYDVLARLGGDEFAILAPGLGIEDAEALASRLLTALNTTTYSAGGHFVRLSASVGAVAYPYHGETAEELLSNADVAMYAAKGQGGACVRFPDADNLLRAGMRSRAEWNERITRSLQDNSFVVFAQPIVRVCTGEIERYELLIRMVEDGQLIPPGEFLPAAEKLGLIKDIDRWMVKQAVALLSDGVFDGIQVEVNLSGKAFSDPEMIPAMSAALREAHVDPGRLGLEITETAAIADMIHAQTFISALKDFGCRFSLDDFGSGFSSFYYLKHLPIDCLKIDGGFIRDLPHSLQDQHLVRGMADLCKGLGIEAAAEFVEDAETLEMLSDLGIDFVQGFHLGRPMPVSELTPAGARN